MSKAKPVTRCEAARTAYEAGEITHAEMVAVLTKWMSRVKLGPRHERLVLFMMRTVETRGATALYRDR